MLRGRYGDKMFLSSYLMPVDAVALIPQLWPQGWHAWLSRWWQPWRQRAWPVLAHSVTPTVPTYLQLDAKWERHTHTQSSSAIHRGHMCSNLRKDKLKVSSVIWIQKIWNQICLPQIQQHQLKECWNIWPGISSVWRRGACCWWDISNTEKRFAETAHNSSLGTNDSDMQMCLLPFYFPPQPVQERQGEWKCLIMSLSVSFIYLYAVIKNSFFFTKT